MEPFDPLLRREAMVGLAVPGAAVASVGSLTMRKGSRDHPRTASPVPRIGYGLTGASIAFFIAAGFSGRSPSRPPG